LATCQHSTDANPRTDTRDLSKPLAQSDANTFAVANPSAESYAKRNPNPNAYPHTEW
jgi:hypothetical protein